MNPLRQLRQTRRFKRRRFSTAGLDSGSTRGSVYERWAGVGSKAVCCHTAAPVGSIKS